MGFDLRKSELGIAWVHLSDLLSGRSTQYFNNLHQLIYPAVTRKYGLTK